MEGSTYAILVYPNESNPKEQQREGEGEGSMLECFRLPREEDERSAGREGWSGQSRPSDMSDWDWEIWVVHIGKGIFFVRTKWGPRRQQHLSWGKRWGGYCCEIGELTWHITAKDLLKVKSCFEVEVLWWRYACCVMDMPNRKQQQHKLT